MDKFFRLVRKYEPYLFLLILIGLLSENFISQWLITLDGPAHMYNSVVARDLLTNPASNFAPVFQINTNPVPNSLDHLILIGLGSFLPLPIADKILHILIVAGICLAFRFLVRQIHPEQSFSSWLIFPFCQTAIYYLGFYNFELGVFLCLLTTAFWLRSEKQKLNVLTILPLLIFSTLLYFTHLVPFLLMVMIVGLRLLLLLFQKEYKLFLHRSSALLISLIPAIIVFAIYYSNRSESFNPPQWADYKESLWQLFTLKHIYLHKIEQSLPAQLISILLLSAVLFAAIYFFYKRKLLSREEKGRYIFWFACWFIVAALIFISPDDFGGSGMMTARLIEISWVMLLLFIVSSMINEKIMMLVGFVCAAVGIIEMSHHRESISSINQDAHKVLQIGQEIKPKSTGVYIALNYNFFKSHLGELAFIENKTASFSNYETIHDFFIVKWNLPFTARYSVGGLLPADLNWHAGVWPDSPGKPEKNIDYVLLCKEDLQDTLMYNRLQDSLDKYYRLKREDLPFQLYESKSIDH